MDAQSKFYDVIYNNKSYPPKLIVSYANFFANGTILNRDTFSGGINTECFQLLEENGFKIIPKEHISQLIFSFLDRVHTSPNNLKKLDFTEEFHGFRVNVGFGQGNKAKIPWIALLGDGQEVSEGIYPVYLYYQQQNALILSFGVSETRPSKIHWDVTAQTINAYFIEHWNVKPDRYGDSFFFAKYQVDQTKPNYGISKSKLTNDIKEVIQLYAFILAQKLPKFSTVPAKRSKAMSRTFDLTGFLLHLKDAHLQFSELSARRFITALAAKPFVILTGLSGSGKTKLALAFAKWITEDKKQICIIPVGADWTNREPLLGFPNMQLRDTYVSPENGALSLILEAEKNPTKPYFMILDEMNLSHVERYFADFLSCMESGDHISLHPGPKNWNNGEIPPNILLPRNLFIIGTVNIDETTYMFSPKVLDRASVIEFRISAEDMKQFLNQGAIASLENLKHKGADMAESFVQLATETNSLDELSKLFKDEILKFFTVLQQVGAEFGYRTATETIIFSNIAPKISSWEENQIMDAIIMQKLLPRVHGSRRKLESILKKLAEFCLNDGADIDKYLKAEGQLSDITTDERVKYKISLDKIQRMYSCLIANSFTSYAEA